MNKKAVLELRSIYKRFTTSGNELKVLENISLSIYAGEIVALVGPSGCGKTTLLNIAADLLKPNQGDVVQRQNLRTAYIFQEPRLLPWKTAEANISFVQDSFLPPEEAAVVRADLLRKTGLAPFRDAFPAQLSGGMKQRLEIIRALSVKPELLLMDEPFKSLDIDLKYQLQELILEQYAQDQFAVLFITHDPEEAVMMADRVILLTDKPARIHREITIEQRRQERSLKDQKIYHKLEEILGFLLKKDIQQAY
jgi:NitT/TauT family transport system ATP-binding protein